MNLGPHADFIVVAYVATIAVVLSLIVWIAIDHRRQQRILADLDARGVRRRADAAPTQTRELGAA